MGAVFFAQEMEARRNRLREMAVAAMERLKE